MKERENTTRGGIQEREKNREKEIDREREEGEHCVRVSIRKQFSSFYGQIVSEKPTTTAKLIKNQPKMYESMCNGSKRKSNR